MPFALIDACRTCERNRFCSVLDKTRMTACKDFKKKEGSGKEHGNAKNNI